MKLLSVAEAVAVLASERSDEAAVVTMSALAFWPLRDADYRLVSLMGAAGSIGLGLALGRPDRAYWIIDGDGSLLMQLGVLPAIGTAKPPNLTHVVIANGVYAISGAQPIPAPLDWERMFLGSGYELVAMCDTEADIRSALQVRSDGPRGIVIRCSSERPEFPPNAFSVNPAEETSRMAMAHGSGGLSASD